MKKTKRPVRYIAQRYARYAIYEPAEGGYYYEGLEPDDTDELIICDTKEAAVEALQKFVQTQNEQYGINPTDEGYLSTSATGLYAGSLNHRYIGEGEEFYVEPMNRRGRHRKGREIYC